MPDYNNHADEWFDDKPTKHPKREIRSVDRSRIHFEIEDKIQVKLDYDFAIALGNFLLESDVEDKRFKSFGHQLMRFDGGD